jgi:hypothetical protein
MHTQSKNTEPRETTKRTPAPHVWHPTSTPLRLHTRCTAQLSRASRTPSVAASADPLLLAPPARVKFPLYISQDGDDPGVQEVVNRHLAVLRLSYLQHVERAPPVLEHPKDKPAYYRIANHYRRACGHPQRIGWQAAYGRQSACGVETCHIQ